MPSAPLTHNQIWTALDRLAVRSKLSPSGLAKRSGLDPTTFNKSKRITPDGRARRGQDPEERGDGQGAQAPDRQAGGAEVAQLRSPRSHDPTRRPRMDRAHRLGEPVIHALGESAPFQINTPPRTR